MADVPISGLTALAAAPAVGDLLVIVDISDPTQAATGTTKRLTVANLFTSPVVASGITVTGTTAVAALTATTIACTDTVSATKSTHASYFATISNPDTTTADFSTQVGWQVAVAGNTIGSLKSTAKNLTGLTRSSLYLTTAAVYDLAFGINNSATPSGWFDGSTGVFTVTAGITVGSTTLLTTNAALTNGAAAATGTLTNAPAAGNPTKWVPINDNGTTRYIPAW